MEGPVNGSRGVKKQALLCWGTGAVAESSIVDGQDVVGGGFCKHMVGGRTEALSYVAGILD